MTGSLAVVAHGPCCRTVISRKYTAVVCSGRLRGGWVSLGGRTVALTLANHLFLGCEAWTPAAARSQPSTYAGHMQTAWPVGCMDGNQKTGQPHPIWRQMGGRQADTSEPFFQNKRRVTTQPTPRRYRRGTGVSLPLSPLVRQRHLLSPSTVQCIQMLSLSQHKTRWLLALKSTAAARVSTPQSTTPSLAARFPSISNDMTDRRGGQWRPLRRASGKSSTTVWCAVAG